MSNAMQAMNYAKYGGPEVLERSEIPMPKLGPGSVLIRVKAASVNPVDWKVMGGYLDALMDVNFPVVPGWDVAGIVEAVGPDTPEFAPGDEVYSYGRRDTVQGGTFAEYVLLPISAVARKPKELSWEEAAALPLVGLTALRALDFLKLQPGENLLIHNGSGGVGRIAIQLAKHAGVNVVATGSAKNHPRLAELGATPVEYGDGLVERLAAIAPEKFDAVADMVGGVEDITLQVLKEGGQHSSIMDPSVDANGGHSIWTRPDARELDRLSELVSAGALVVDIAESYPMERAAEAIISNMKGTGGGKVVLTQFS